MATTQACRRFRRHSAWGRPGTDTLQALAPTPLTGIYIRPVKPNIGPDLATLLASRPDPDARFAYRKRMIESGPRIASNNYEVVQFLAGGRGTLAFAQEWDRDAHASWGNVSRTAIEELTLGDDHGASICG